VQLLRQYFCAKKVQTLNLSTKKLCPKLSYEKGVRKMLVKLTPGVNFTNLMAQSVNAPIFVIQFNQQKYSQLY
jgi:hypothetical protein